MNGFANAALVHSVLQRAARGQIELVDGVFRLGGEALPPEALAILVVLRKHQFLDLPPRASGVMLSVRGMQLLGWLNLQFRIPVSSAPVAGEGVASDEAEQTDALAGQGRRA